MAQAVGSRRNKRRSTRRRVKKLKNRRRQRGGYVAGFPRMNNELLERAVATGQLSEGIKSSIIQYLTGVSIKLPLLEEILKQQSRFQEIIFRNLKEIEIHRKAKEDLDLKIIDLKDISESIRYPWYPSITRETLLEYIELWLSNTIPSTSALNETIYFLSYLENMIEDFNRDALKFYLSEEVGDGVKNNFITDIVSDYLERKVDRYDSEEIQNNINFLQQYVTGFEDVLQGWDKDTKRFNSLQKVTESIKEVIKLLKAIKMTS